MSVDRLVFTGLCRRFGRLTVLENVSGRLSAGGLLTVRGANGSGKSTLLRCLAGLLAVERGEIRLERAGALLDPAARRRAVGFVAPDLALYDELTVAENLALFARLRGLGGERGEQLAARLSLPLARPWRVLSSGMRQRLRWAWALLHEPRLLLLDEPFQNLDESGEEIARRLLEEHLDRGGLAVVASPVALPFSRDSDELRLGR